MPGGGGSIPEYEAEDITAVKSSTFGTDADAYLDEEEKQPPRGARQAPDMAGHIN